MDGPDVSFAAFVDSRADGLVGLAVLVTRDWEDARDAVQDALAALYPRWSELPGSGDLERYVNRAVVNACLKVRRRRSRTVAVAEVEWLPRAGEVPDHAASVVLARQAWLLCAELPPVQRAAVALRFYQDLSYGEIAEVLGCREATARSHVHRAVSALRARQEEVSDRG